MEQSRNIEYESSPAPFGPLRARPEVAGGRSSRSKRERTVQRTARRDGPHLWLELAAGRVQVASVAHHVPPRASPGAQSVFADAAVEARTRGAVAVADCGGQWRGLQQHTASGAQSAASTSARRAAGVCGAADIGFCALEGTWKQSATERGARALRCRCAKTSDRPEKNGHV